MTVINLPRTIAGRIDELTAAGSLLRERLGGKPQHGIRSASFHRGAAKGNGGAIFPIRRGAAFVPVQLAKLANLRHHVRPFLIQPLMVAGAGQGLLLLRQNRIIHVLQPFDLFNYLHSPIKAPGTIAMAAQSCRPMKVPGAVYSLTPESSSSVFVLVGIRSVFVRFAIIDVVGAYLSAFAAGLSFRSKVWAATQGRSHFRLLPPSE